MRIAGRIRLGLTVLALVAPMACRVVNAETVKDLPAQASGYVNDFAHAFDESSKQQLTELCGELDHQAHAQVAVVTVHTLGGESKENFADDLFRKWGPGAKASDRGVLLLFAIDERQYQTEVGYGLQGILPDAKVGDILRAGLPMLRQKQYGAAALEDVQQIATVIAADAGVTLKSAQGQTQRPVPQHGVSVGTIVRLVFFLILLLLLFRRRGGRGGGYGGGGGFLPGLWLGSMLGGGGNRGWSDGGGGGGGNGDSGFGGFGGGSSDGGGAGGSW